MTPADPVRLPAIAFLGAGSMARAIIAGLLQPGVVVDGGIRTTNRTAEKAAELAGLEGVTAYATETDVAANHAAVAGASLVVVAVKPAMVPDLLREIAAPALVISGFFDILTPPYQSKEIADRIPNAEYVRLWRSSHFSMLERPEIVIPAMKRFLEEKARY